MSAYIRRGMMKTFIFDFITDRLCYLFHILRQWNDDFEVFIARPIRQIASNLFVPAILSASHGSHQVIADDHRDVRIFIDLHQGSCHAAMVNVGSPMTATAGHLSLHRSTFRHTDHAPGNVHTRNELPCTGHEAECITTDITEDTSIGIISKHFVSMPHKTSRCPHPLHNAGGRGVTSSHGA